MWKLVIEDDEGKRTIVPLTRDDYTIGRKEGNTIRLTERNVSREHAKLLKRNGITDDDGASIARYVLEDLTSYNGVYINGLRVAQAQELAHGDLIQIGDYRIILQDDAAADTDTTIPLDSDDLKATSPGLTALPLRSEMMLQQPNRLIMLAGPTPGQEFPLVGDRLTIGRAEEASISVNHNSVSRLHCEVHALGEGRFEIVDKGSSNGVRVNGADLRRGIIEAGDVIELGDVKFKFVGQGQIFRPGTSESQQFAALSNRTASMIAAERRRGSIVPYIVLGAIVGIFVAGWFYWRPRPEPIAATPVASPAPVSADMATLLEAKRICDANVNDCEAAHQRVSQLPDGSSARTTDEFRTIEYKWASTTLLRADTETDVGTKRLLLERVANTNTVDPALRSTANERLQLLESGPVVVSKDAGKSVAVVAPPHSATHSQAPDSAPVAAAPPPHPTRQPAPPRIPISTLMLSDNPNDWQKARDTLEPRVFGGHGSYEDVRDLKAICKRQSDRTCVEACKQFEQPTSSSP
jgi:pSer/pThr/pTyr-binding forkhead associated (FHA) protein